MYYLQSLSHDVFVVDDSHAYLHKVHFGECKFLHKIPPMVCEHQHPPNQRKLRVWELYIAPRITLLIAHKEENSVQEEGIKSEL